MKKSFISSILAAVLFLSMVPALAAQTNIQVQVNGKQVVFPDAQPIISSDELMVPIRFIVEEMGAQVKWSEEANAVAIINGQDTIIFKTGEKVVIFNSTSKTINAASFQKNNRTYVSLTFFTEIFGYTAIYHPESHQAIISADSSTTVEIPEGIQEEEVIVGKGTPYELKGTLTLPINRQNPLAAVVLVQGSGPSDRDETVYAIKPFRDIAWGLAQQGFAVLRYDKRTYVYGSTYKPEDLIKFTVNEETVGDAILAANLLKSDPRVNPSQVYLIGHSLGGMLAPRIDADGGNFAGIVIMAGSARSLWEIIYDQNVAALKAADMDSETRKANETFIDKELENAGKLKDMTDTEAMKTTLFGIPAYYFKEMDSRNIKELSINLKKPVLVQQGEEDFQVYADKDFVLWKDLLKNNDNAAFKLYPGLNHMFMQSTGEGKGTIAEYQQPSHVEQEVINDIANWIHLNSK